MLVLHAVVCAALLWWSWRRWPDPLVDFGRELYLPWRINAGEVLYRDLASLFGPLSPHVNALWFRLFGASLLTLALCNLVILAVTVAGIYHLVRLSTDRVTASTAGLATLLLFGFSQYVAVGNYNFITPYSHEVTHGIALSVACLVCLHRAIALGSRWSSAAAGACFGLVLLTKPDIAAAAAAGVLAAWLAVHALGGRDGTGLVASVPIFLAASIVPPVLFFCYFAGQVDAPAALRATGGAWVPLFGTGITSNEFYRRGMGLDAPWAGAGLALAAFAVFLAIVGAATAVSWTASDDSPPSLVRRLSRLGLMAGVLALLSRGAFPRALPLIVVTTIAAVTTLFLRCRERRHEAVRLVPLLMWSAFALVLLAKLGLHTRAVHYGFYLAMPATVVAVASVTWLVPHLLASWRSEPAARSFRQLALWMVAAAIAPYLGVAHGWYRTRTLAIGSGGDRFYASTMDGQWQGRAVRDAVDALRGMARPGATLAVLPEGVMLNYLLRLESPLRVLTVMPPEVMAFGEEDVLRSLAAAPPDFVVLVRKDTSEYGYPPFGSDVQYGRRTLAWIEEHYEGVRVIPGATRDAEAGMRLLSRRKD